MYLNIWSITDSLICNKNSFKLFYFIYVNLGETSSSNLYEARIDFLFLLKLARNSNLDASGKTFCAND